MQDPATILLVDDDMPLRRFLARTLLDQGFRVIEACDGAEALEVASRHPEPIDLLLTDVLMPRVNGVVLAERLLVERPGTPVLYISGYVEKSILLAHHPEWVLLQKPVSRAVLISAVRQLLATGEQPS